MRVTGCDGAFTEAPSDMTLVPGCLLRLNCSSDILAPVEWQYRNITGTGFSTMTAFGLLAPEFTHLFTIDSGNQYDLVATQEQMGESETYCGTYHCVDNNGAGEIGSADVASKYRFIWIITIFFFFVFR